MPRSLWNGSLSFGLVNVPVALHSAIRDEGVHFRQLHEKDGAPIETRRFCSEEDEEVPWEEIVHGYEVSKGRWVALTDEELAAAEPTKTRTIDIEEFVDLAEVDPIYFDHPYFLMPAPGEGAARAYRLLAEVMDASGKVAIGRFVLRTKEYLVALRVRDGAISLTTMLFHDEVRPTKGIAPTAAKRTAPAKEEVDQAVALVDALTRKFDPKKYEDRHRKRLLKIIRDKKKGRKLKLPEPRDEPDAAPDLMAALEESLARAKKGSRAKAASR
ncbi:MAG: Ku protein [Actinomycetota bacterium]|nr:Ku protein [Actinomycetota bacterium]